MPRTLVNAESSGEGWLKATLALGEALFGNLEAAVLAEPGFSEKLGRALRRRGIVFLRPLPGRPEGTVPSPTAKCGPSMLVAKPGPSLDGCGYVAGCRATRGLTPSHNLEADARTKGIPALVEVYA